ncbi:DUF262 domain-containing protein [Gramella sp. MT6]|uniref:DUF262 domain-containing protein n=1 Tax=Gramella sp. MT6 TaxID=2705471 RepID=UPI001C5DB9B3|nr:DUF262 domain-containing protein [Gramella sp. MT6]QYA24280.1 DUF262 domain-containing protein [Gramella sp. MT6]
MAKKVNSETVSLWEILGAPRPYSIPYNQRPYIWDQKNWETLWNSFFSENDKSTFLGSFILLEDDDPTKDVQIFDGQQRITTLTILCKAFIDVLHENGSIANAQDIKAYLLTDHRSNPRLMVSKTLSKYFCENIQTEIHIKPQQGSTDTEKKIFKAYQYFYEQVEELLNINSKQGIDIYELFKKRLSSLEVVKLTISDIILGIEIFESVNATGKKLEADELAKNILIKHANLMDYDVEKFDLEWTEIKDRLKVAGFSFVDFMHYFWISKYPYVGKNQLFRSMKDKFQGDSDKWLTFFSSLKSSSITVENIFSLYSFENFKLHYPKANSNPKYSSKYLRYLQCLRFIKNKSWIIPIFTILDYEAKLNQKNETFIGKNKFHEIIKKHFVFSFLHFNIFSLPTRDFTPAMYKLAKNINKAYFDHPQDVIKSNKEVNKYLQLHFCGKDGYVNKAVKQFELMEDEFIEGIHKLKHKDDNKFLIHTLYGEIEEAIFGGSFHNISSHSIEHYMPQESMESWGIPKSLSKHHENRLGNILIINADLNGKLQNKSHKDKMEILSGHPSNSNFVNEFIEYNESETGPYNFGKITEDNLKSSHPIENPSEIDKRTERIGSYIKKMYIEEMKY